MWFARTLVALGLLGVTPQASGAPKPLPARPFVIALDPGHGGDNSGCRSADGATDEKRLTLTLARRLRAQLLEILPHAQVVLLREGDASVPLRERVAEANRRAADVLVSLHANASPKRDQTGFETWVVDADTHRREVTWLPVHERSTEPVEPSPAGDLALQRLQLSTRHVRAIRLAAAIQAEQRARFPRRIDRGVRQGRLDVLQGATMPAVLFEVGFLDHPDEGKALVREEIQDEVVAGLAAALREYYREVVRRQ